MSYYLSLDEMSQQNETVSYQYNTFREPMKTETTIPSRNVRFQDENETVVFFKESPPNELPQHKFQVPCDTVTTSSSCTQQHQILNMYR